MYRDAIGGRRGVGFGVFLTDKPFLFRNLGIMVLFIRCKALCSIVQTIF
jgi:hypothetical protein